MNELKSVLMTRDNMSPEQADDEIKSMLERMMNGEDPEEILLNDYGLEPDYIMDIMDYY